MRVNHTGSSYRSPSKLGRILCILLITYLFLMLITHGLTTFLNQWLSDFPRPTAENGIPGSSEPNVVLGLALMLLGLALIFISLATLGVSVSALVFLFLWIYRIRKNLVAFNVPGLRFTPGWSVAWFFVPVMNLFRPWQIMKETMRASQPAPPEAEPLSWKTARCSALVHWWWGLTLGADLLWYSIYIAPVIWNLVVEGKWLGISPTASIVYYFAMIPGIVLLVLLVRRLTALQEANYASLSGTPQQPEWVTT